MSFKTTVFLLIFCMDDLSIGISGVKSSLLLLCYCQFLLFLYLLHIFWCSFIDCIYVLTSVISFSYTDSFILYLSLSFVINFVLNSILSYMGIATPTFLSFFFVWNIFLNTLTFSLNVSLALNWVSCKQHIEMSYFLIPISHLMTLIGAFSRLAFKVL